jgi:hypothetical protein
LAAAWRCQRASSTVDDRAHATTVLSCADAGGPTTPPDPCDLTVDGLNFSGVKADGSSPADAIIVSDGKNQYFFRKIFLYVAATAALRTTMTVRSPADARLAYTDLQTWSTRLPDTKLTNLARLSVTVASCGDQLTGYLGGLLVTGPACVVLQVHPEPAGPRPLRSLLPMATADTGSTPTESNTQR